jgi:subtilase family serine protease
MHCSFLPRFQSSLAVFLVPFLALGAAAPRASAAVANRVTTPISGSPAVEIPNSVHPKVRLATDLGPTPADTRLVGMTIRFNMTLPQQAALDQLLADQQNPASPRYHQWLGPTEFGAQFGLSSSDLAKVTEWLTSQGFTVTGVANGGTFITFDGTVAEAEAAFSTSIHNLSLNGESHFANVSNPSLPAAFAGVVSGITGLHNFRIKPHVQMFKPDFTSSISGGHFLAPGDIYTIYDVNPVLTAGITGAGIGTGANCHSVPAGTTCGDIAVTGQVDINSADVLSFRSASGLSTTNLPTTVHEGGDPGSPSCTTNNCSPNDNDLAESSLDVEWSGAMATGATILFVNGPDIFFNSMTQAIDQNLAPIVTTSYGECEAGWGASELNVLNQLFKQANAQGQTVMSAAGDSGATDCDAGTSAIEGLTVDFPASSPYVTGVGGTMFNEGTASGATTYWSAVNGTTGGSATQYIPEAVWNEDSAGFSFSAGGGGVSAFFPRPAWQVETGPAGLTTTVPPDASRDVPDLSLDAAASHDPFLYCYLSSCINGYRQANSNLTVAGGTSFDSQIFGGMLALIEQKTGSRTGNANQTLYALGNNATYFNTGSTSVFHDITTGNNSNPCTGGTVNCPNGGTIGYTAGVGYDLATGWGSIDLNNLANAWKLVTPLGLGSAGPAISSTALAASSLSLTAGATVTLTATVTGASGTPTGTVQFLVNNGIVGSATLNGSGVASYTYTTSCSTIGQLVLSASYLGDPIYAGSKGPLNPGQGQQTSNGTVQTSPLIAIVAPGTCPDFTVTTTTPTLTVGAGATLPTATISANSVNGFAGVVAFSATVASTSGYLPTLTLNPASVILSSNTSATTVLSLNGISAALKLPAMPGQTGSRTMPWYAAGSGVTVASLLLLVLPRRRRLGGLLLLALSVAIAAGATGCGSNTAVAPATTNPYVGTYIVTVTGTSTISGVVTSNSTTVTYSIQ